MTSQTAILEAIIEPEDGGFSAELARYLLKLRFPNSMRSRYLALSEKAQQGTLNAEEQADLDAFLGANALLMVLQSKARTSLSKHNSAA